MFVFTRIFVFITLLCEFGLMMATWLLCLAALLALPSAYDASPGDLPDIEALLETAVRRRIDSTCHFDAWGPPYAQLHHQGLLQPAEAKFLVAVPNLSEKDYWSFRSLTDMGNTGLADRVIGIATAFSLAVLTNRVFQIGLRPPLLPLHLLFSSPYINWTRAEDPAWLLDPLKHDAKVRQYNASVLGGKEFFAINTINDVRLQDRILYQNLTELLSDAHVVMMVINRGKTVRMFENPFHVKQLQAMKLQTHTLFGCLVHYLFVPRPHLFSPLQPLLATLASAPADSGAEVLKIGIQIRVGDHSFNGNHQDGIEHYSAFFSCAQQIEKMVALDRSRRVDRVVWFLLTESLELRKAAIAKYGAEKIVTSVQHSPEHSSKESNACQSTDCTVSSSGFALAAAEWYLFSLTEYHVISEYSGYGRSAAMLSLRANSIYTIRHNQLKKAVTCNANTFTSLEELFYDWSGVRT